MTYAEIWFVCAPFVILAAMWCWDTGMDILVP
jgi:hypothetical protein